MQTIIYLMSRAYTLTPRSVCPAPSIARAVRYVPAYSNAT